jgi:hypothetical protein
VFSSPDQKTALVPVAHASTITQPSSTRHAIRLRGSFGGGSGGPAVGPLACGGAGGVGGGAVVMLTGEESNGVRAPADAIWGPVS